MSFVLAPRNEIKSRVALSIPGDFGKTEKAHIEVTWKRLPVSDKKAITEEFQAGTLNDEDALDRLILNIGGCQTPEGEKITYTSDLLIQLLEEDYIRKALVDEMMALLYGKEALEAIRRKN